jgi:hypothetical protein
MPLQPGEVMGREGLRRHQRALTVEPAHMEPRGAPQGRSHVRPSTQGRPSLRPPASAPPRPPPRARPSQRRRYSHSPFWHVWPAEQQLMPHTVVPCAQQPPAPFGVPRQLQRGARARGRGAALERGQGLACGPIPAPPVQAGPAQALHCSTPPTSPPAHTRTRSGTTHTRGRATGLTIGCQSRQSPAGSTSRHRRRPRHSTRR